MNRKYIDGSATMSIKIKIFDLSNLPESYYYTGVFRDYCMNALKLNNTMWYV